MVKQRGVATLAAVGIIVAAFTVGALAEHYSKENDGPLEQMSERLLRAFGVHYDFSKDNEPSAEHASYKKH